MISRRTSGGTIGRNGETLTAVTDHLRCRLGIGPRVVPMSDQPVRTMVETDEGTLPFQTYFVGRRCEPRLRSIRFEGAATARPSPAVLSALTAPDLAGIIVCPSNPWLSIDPLLAILGFRGALATRAAPMVVVTPLVAGQAIKGPTAKIMSEMGLPLDVQSIVAHYRGLIDGFVLDAADGDKADSLGLPVAVTDTVMKTLADRERVARTALELCRPASVRPART